MLARLQDEKKQKEAEIQRLQDIQRLDSMVNSDVQSGMLFSSCEGKNFITVCHLQQIVLFQ